MNKDIGEAPKPSDSEDINKSVMSRIKKFFLQMMNVIVEAVSTIFLNIIG